MFAMKKESKKKKNGMSPKWRQNIEIPCMHLFQGEFYLKN